MPDDSPTHPLTRDEFDLVSELAFAIAESTGAGDAERHQDAVRLMREWIAALRGKYGEHPVLLETLADFEDDVAVQIPLYADACERAVSLGLPTVSIRLALAGVLLDGRGDVEGASAQLEAGERELAGEGADSDQREDLEELRARCRAGRK